MKKKNKIPIFDEWEIKDQTSPSKFTSTSKLREVLLKNRDISKKDSKDFFNPKSPFDIELKEMKIDQKQVNLAVKRIIKAIKNDEKIIIYGDYDADGITATAILWEAIYALKADVLPYIPDRFTHGYGIKYEAVKELHEKYPNIGLIITVDNGIVAVKDSEMIQKSSIDLIITDHHQKEKVLPKANAIVHTTEITGAGIAWVLAREIYKKLDKNNNILQKSLDLAAIGTIADIATLVGPNRSFAKHGLDELNKLERQGLAGLANTIGLSPGSIGTYTVGFILAPRLNAMGRIDQALESLRLLCTTNRRRIQKLSHILNSVNSKRQKILDDVIEHALKNFTFVEDSNSIVVAHESYHEGVIGLAASKMVEEYYLPSIVLSKGEELSKASARSISGFNIIKAIRQLDHLIEGGGGHPMAAGFTIKTKNIEIFIQEFEKIAKKDVTKKLRKKKLKIDTYLNLDQINPEVYALTQQFEPLGPGNPAPSFVSKIAKIRDIRTVGKENKHLKMNLEQNSVSIEAIAFGFGFANKYLNKDDIIEVAYYVDENRWNGNVSLQIKIKDLKLAS